jgi:hypothetical protein
MKKLSPLLIVVLVIVGSVAAYTFFGSRTTPVTSTDTTTNASSQNTQQPTQKTETVSRTAMNTQMNSQSAPGTGNDEEPEEQIKPAPQAYASSDEALAAVLKGAKDYDDSILEQFTLPDPNCSWCSEFYTSVRDLAMNQNTPQEQRAYLAELLAISGRPENVQALIESVKNAPSNDAADLYAEALELSLGREDIVVLLGEQMTATNDTLREASVAAVTNQGTKQAAELLIKDAKERGDPDLYYAQGIGIGEVIPDEEAIPAYQEFVRERLPSSHLGVKALLNAGLPGVQAVFDELENSPNPDADTALLKDVGDHINIDDEIIALADRKLAENNNPRSVELARMIREQSQNAEQGGEGEMDVEAEDVANLSQ